MPERETPSVLVASSITSPDFSLTKTINFASRNGADGVQLYINLANLYSGQESLYQIRDTLDQFVGQHNIIHLPGKLGLIELLSGMDSSEIKEAGVIGSELIKPIPSIGKVMVAHHDTSINYEIDFGVTAIKGILSEIADSDVVVGLENTNPNPQPEKPLSYEELNVQVEKCLDFLRAMQVAEIPTILVLDAARFWSRNPLLKDQGYKLFESIFSFISGQKVIVHVSDFRHFDFSPVDPLNAEFIGQGVMTPPYKKMVEIAKKHGVEILMVVNESETPRVITPKNIQYTRKLFS